MGLTSLFRDGNGRKKNAFCSRYSGREEELPKSFPAIRDWNGNYQKYLPLFGTGTGNPKTLPAVWEREFKAFPLGNIREREFPLMPGLPKRCFRMAKNCVYMLNAALNSLFVTYIMFLLNFLHCIGP